MAEIYFPHSKSAYMKFVALILCSLLINQFSFSQSSAIDPTWDNYYNEHPSGIRTSYSGSDFIDVANSFGFIPKRPGIDGDMKIFTRVLLGLEERALKQISISGDYYSRTMKHKDYFYLYNSLYKKVSESDWNKYCPYFIGLMIVDRAIKV